MSYKLELTKNQNIRMMVCAPTISLPTAVSGLLDQLNSSSSFEVGVFAAFDEILNKLTETSVPTILVLGIENKDEFVQVLQILTSFESNIQQGLLKVLVFSKMNHPRVLSVLKSKGVSEIPELNINLKALGYKIKNLTQQIQQNQDQPKRSGLDGTGVSKSSSRSGPTGGAQKGSQLKVNWTAPLEHFSDFWLVLNPKHARYVIGKWMVNFYGPGPNAGTWEETKLEQNGERGWQFNPRVPTDMTFYKDAGRWVFFGNCPEFSWEQRIWYFISKKPTFAFYSEGQIVHEKIKFLESGDIELSQNSENGKALKSAITNTIEASILLHSDKEKKKGKVAFEQDETDSKELEGAFEAEEATELNYRGKGEESTELDYRGKNEESPELYGEISADIAREINRNEGNFESTQLKLNILSKNGEPFSSHDPIQLIELRETQAIIDIPVGLLTVGDEIELRAEIQEGKKTRELVFKASTKIVESDLNDGTPQDHQRAAAICELNQSIKVHFTDVVDQLQAKRELLDNFFKKAKGA